MPGGANGRGAKAFASRSTHKPGRRLTPYVLSCLALTRAASQGKPSGGSGGKAGPANCQPVASSVTGFSAISTSLFGSPEESGGGQQEKNGGSGDAGVPRMPSTWAVSSSKSSLPPVYSPVWIADFGGNDNEEVPCGAGPGKAARGCAMGIPDEIA